MFGIDPKGVGYVMLQALRVCTVISLAAASVACWTLIIKVDKHRAVFVFECMSLFFTSVVAAMLIFTEFPVVKFIERYLRSNWPILSPAHGLTWLGVAIITIGCNILGTLNQPAYDNKKLGPHFSKLTLGAGVLCITFGFLNIVCSLACRIGLRGVTARDLRARGKLAEPRRRRLSESSTVYDEKSSASGGGKPFTRPQISGPYPAHQDVEREAQSPSNPAESPVAPGIRRPQSAMHPMHALHSDRSSMYSETSRMDRFTTYPTHNHSRENMI